jgi:hypothetical protein
MARRGRLGCALGSVVLAAVLLVGAPVESAEAQEWALIRRVEATLEAGVETNQAEDAILALGEQGERAVRAVFERDGAPVYVRLRALSLLSRFETEESARYLERLIMAAQQPDESLGALHPARSSLVLRRALEGLLPVAELLDPQPKLDALSFCLAHRDAHVRKAAADLLAKLESREVDLVLAKQLTNERSAMVRGRVQHALTSRSAALRRAR